MPRFTGVKAEKRRGANTTSPVSGCTMDSLILRACHRSASVVPAGNVPARHFRMKQFESFFLC